MVGEVIDIVEEGNRLIRFEYEGIFEEVLDELGQMPLPPYITHRLEDKDRYQTVYATHTGSAAAPTAGLHFTKELLAQIKEKGIKIARVTLHVGLGTFRPVKVENILEHHMHSEFYVIDEEAANTINETKAMVARSYRLVQRARVRSRRLQMRTDMCVPAVDGRISLSIRDINSRWLTA